MMTPVVEEHDDRLPFDDDDPLDDSIENEDGEDSPARDGDDEREDTDDDLDGEDPEDLINTVV